jgi:hypothetical protein
LLLSNILPPDYSSVIQFISTKKLGISI